MADISANFAIRVFAVQALPGVAIVAPFACRRVVLFNGDASNPVSLFTDPASVGPTTKNLPASGTEIIQSTDMAFAAGQVICYAASAVSTGPISATFTR